MLHALCSLFHILSGLAFIYIFIYLFIYLYFFCFIHPCPFSRFATVSALLWHFGRHFCSFPAGCWCVWVRFHWFLPWVQSVLSQLADFISFHLIFLAHLTRFSSDSFILLTSSFFLQSAFGFFFLGWNWFAVFGHFGVWCIFRQFLGRVFLFSFEDFYSVFFLQRLIFFCPTFTAIFGIYSISFSLYSRFWLVYDRYFAFSNGFLTSFLVYSRFFFSLYLAILACLWPLFGAFFCVKEYWRFSRDISVCFGITGDILLHVFDGYLIFVSLTLANSTDLRHLCAILFTLRHYEVCWGFFFTVFCRLFHIIFTFVDDFDRFVAVMSVSVVISGRSLQDFGYYVTFLSDFSWLVATLVASLQSNIGIWRLKWSNSPRFPWKKLVRGFFARTFPMFQGILEDFWGSFRELRTGKDPYSALTAAAAAYKKMVIHFVHRETMPHRSRVD